MPHIPTLPPSTRIFGRLDHFLVECPACGEIIGSSTKGYLPKRLASLSRARAAAATLPNNPAVRALVYNPFSQRLRCPYCDTVWVCGLILYTAAPRSKSDHVARTVPPLPAPPDVIPNRRQVVAMRQQARGWWARRGYTPGQEVNLVVDQPCSCDPLAAPDPTCPVHGDHVVSAALPPK